MPSAFPGPFPHSQRVVFSLPHHAVGMEANYVAVLSADVCAIHNWSDGANIVRRIVSLKLGNTAVTRCFSTQDEALCWPTDPLQTEAVAGSAPRIVGVPQAAEGSLAPWLALVSRSIASCVMADAVGLSSAIGALRNARDGACAVRRFPSAREAWHWVGTGAAR